MNNYSLQLCNLCKRRANNSERKLFHAVKCNFQLIDADCACNSEVPDACRAEGLAVAHEDVRLIQQHIAELVVRKSGFLYAGKLFLPLSFHSNSLAAPLEYVFCSS